MKKGPSKETLQTYLSCFVEIKNALEENPRVKLTDFAHRYKIGKQPLTVLKSTGIITKNGKAGHKWTGPEPNYKMILDVLEIIRRYHAELKQRKSEQGDLFTKSKRRGWSKGSQTPKFVNPEVEKNINLWRENYQKQTADQTAIPIRIEIYDRSTAADFYETEKIKVINRSEQKQLNRTILKNIFTAIKNLFKWKK